MTRNRRAWLLTAAVALAFVCACSNSNTTDPETVAPTDSAAPTTLSAETTAGETLPTSTVPAVDPLLLRGDGFGAFDFDASYEDVLAGIPLTVVTDTESEYQGPGYSTPEGAQVYQYPFGRTLCWDDGGGGKLCVYFGGSDAVGARRFTGWTYESATVGTLVSSTGASVNKLLSELPELGFTPRADCFGYTELRDVDNIYVSVLAGAGAVFGTYAAEGFVPTVPVPPTAYVSFMTAGVTPYAMMTGECLPGQTRPIGL